jgi:hypothetical protein
MDKLVDPEELKIKSNRLNFRINTDRCNKACIRPINEFHLKRLVLKGRVTRNVPYANSMVKEWTQSAYK